MSTNCIDYPTLSNEHTWEDLHIQLRNQQTCTSDNHNFAIFANAFIVDLLMQ